MTSRRVETPRLRRFNRTHRLFLFTLPLALCTVGCSWQSQETEYAKGITVNGQRGSFQRISWYKSHSPELPCPSIVVHLPGLDLDNTHLSSSKAMRELGAVVQNEHNLKGRKYLDLTLERDGARIMTCFENDSLARVLVTSMGSRKINIAVDGNNIALPASKDELLGAFGQPVKARTVYHPVGDIDGTRARSEPHL